MECDDNGIKQAQAGSRCGLKRKRRADSARIVRLAFSAAVPRPAAARLLPRSACPTAPNPPPTDPTAPLSLPFMSNMDEISYWIYTKRAPCLFNYDNILKKQSDQGQCSSTKPPSINSKEQEQSPKKKKIKLLEKDSIATRQQQNVYFKAIKLQKPVFGSGKSIASSEVDFDIKTSSAQNKAKNMKSQKSMSKKNKVATSTPKVVNLRRSLRNTQHKWNNINSSFEIFNTSIINGKKEGAVEEEAKCQDKVATKILSKSKAMLSEKEPNDVPNGQFEDVSDVSGFTANYIRSTKIHSSKRPQKLRSQNSRTLNKHSKQRVERNKMIMCVNKSINTGFPDAAVLNCSTDSSQNALKLVTVKHNEQSTSMNKSTSLLKFMETKIEDNINSKNNKHQSKINLDIPFQSPSSGTSRYPIRHKINIETPVPNCSTNIAIPKANTASRRHNKHKETLNINQEENSEEKLISRTRSGRRRGLKLDVEPSPSMVQLNSSTDVSYSAALNVVSPNTKSTRENNSSSRCLRSRTVRDKIGQFYKESSSEGSNKKLSDTRSFALEQTTPKRLRKVKKTLGRTGHSLSRDFLRDKSGFAACFSDSDSDSAPLKQRKFFCQQ